MKLKIDVKKLKPFNKINLRQYARIILKNNKKTKKVMHMCAQKTNPKGKGKDNAFNEYCMCCKKQGKPPERVAFFALDYLSAIK